MSYLMGGHLRWEVIRIDRDDERSPLLQHADPHAGGLNVHGDAQELARVLNQHRVGVIGHQWLEPLPVR